MKGELFKVIKELQEKYHSYSNAHIDRVLKLAKEEFPMYWNKEGHLCSKVKSKDDFNDIFLAAEWFKKWFGDSE
jgi:hypothetical protein